MSDISTVSTLSPQTATTFLHQHPTTKRKRIEFQDQVCIPPVNFSSGLNSSFVLPTATTSYDQAGALSPGTQVVHQFYNLALSNIEYDTPSDNLVTKTDINEGPQHLQPTNSMARLAQVPPPSTQKVDSMDIDEDKHYDNANEASNSSLIVQKADVNSDLVFVNTSPVTSKNSSQQPNLRQTRGASRRSARNAAKSGSQQSRNDTRVEKSRSRGCVRKPRQSATSLNFKDPKPTSFPTETQVTDVQEIARDPREPPRVVDPIRAALTWKEEEITVYDPNDKDDDGVGMDGVAFEPPPKLAKIRDRKRRAQLAAYKKQLEDDARANRRNKRGQETSNTESKKVRRVHFLDTAVTS